MRKSRRYLATGALAAALASLVAHAAQPSSRHAPRAEAAGNASASRMTPSTPVWVPPTVPIPVPLPTGPTNEDVGDADSFGRPLKWLGVVQANVYLAEDCSLPQYEGSNCAQAAPGPAVTTFNFADTSSITLPGNAAHSLLCHWFSPFLVLDYENPGPEPVVAYLQYYPQLRIQSEVLLDPALRDPNTGRPFAGSLVAGVSSSERVTATLLANEQREEALRDSTTCIAGFLTRRQLVESYGLTDAQARLMFSKPMTISIEVSGYAQNVAMANMVFGLRIIGD